MDVSLSLLATLQRETQTIIRHAAASSHPICRTTTTSSAESEAPTEGLAIRQRVVTVSSTNQPLGHQVVVEHESNNFKANNALIVMLYCSATFFQ